MFYSPLRYPGGKSKLSKFISQICLDNDIDGHYIEPFAGGASVALCLLIEGYVKKITINDIDKSIYSFWHSVLNKTNKFCNLIKKTDITVKNWYKMRDIQKNKSEVDLLTLGFSTFFLNRTNISGIIDGGMIGGKKQKGKYRLDCRFNKVNLIKRIKLIAKHRKKITIHGLDAVELIDKVSSKRADQNTIFYFDPPYYLKGQSLYMNAYKTEDHQAVSKKISEIKNAKWIVSYDSVNDIKKMYKNYRKIEYSLSYTAAVKRKGQEVLFFSKNLNIPSLSI